jgi:hypothetical protein
MNLLLHSSRSVHGWKWVKLFLFTPPSFAHLYGYGGEERREIDEHFFLYKLALGPRLNLIR